MKRQKYSLKRKFLIFILLVFLVAAYSRRYYLEKGPISSNFASEISNFARAALTDPASLVDPSSSEDKNQKNGAGISDQASSISSTEADQVKSDLINQLKIVAKIKLSSIR